jgi:CPA1 family monovalent cation:H+ antiporter
MVIRLMWVFPFTYGPRYFFSRFRGDDPYPPWQNTLLVAWTGMRGAVTLAAALAVPLTVDGGGAFPERDEIIFLAFSVIMGTLLVQGLTLPLLIHFLGVDDVDPQLEREENKARIKVVNAAIERVDELSVEEWVRDDTAERVRRLYDYRLRRFSARFDDDGTESDDIEERAGDYQRLLRELLDAQRAMLIQLRNEGRINDDIMRRIERELDLEDSRLEI